MKITENVPLSSLTTMRLGGPARYVIEIETPSDLETAHAFIIEKNLPFFILGGGANTIGHDEGFPGVIIKNTMVEIDARDVFSEDRRLGRTPRSVSSEKASGHQCHLVIMGGTVWDDAVAYACDRGYTGIEALSKIPGLASAAPVQNIGAYGQDVSETFVSAEVYDFKEKTFKTLTKADLNFSYRKSILNTTEKNRYFVISITLELKQGQMSRPFYNSIEKYIADHHCTDFSPSGIRKIVSTIRADKLPDPLEKASSGSFFKNIYLSEEEAKLAEAKGYPVYRGHDGIKINSGWLIEQCGLKGQLLHGMRVSNTAALVLINESAKSYADLAAARTEIIAAVQDKFGYTLEQEPMEI